MAIVFLVAAVIAGLFSLLVLSHAWRLPLVFRMAVRNIWRRKATAGFIVLGAMVGTALLSSSLAIGDTMRFSLNKTILDQLGELDEVVVTQAASDQNTFFSVDSIKNVFFPGAAVDYLKEQKDNTIEAYLPRSLVICPRKCLIPLPEKCCRPSPTSRYWY